MVICWATRLKRRSRRQPRIWNRCVRWTSLDHETWDKTRWLIGIDKWFFLRSYFIDIQWFIIELTLKISTFHIFSRLLGMFSFPFGRLLAAAPRCTSKPMWKIATARRPSPSVAIALSSVQWDRLSHLESDGKDDKDFHLVVEKDLKEQIAV